MIIMSLIMSILQAMFLLFLFPFEQLHKINNSLPPNNRSKLNPSNEKISIYMYLGFSFLTLAEVLEIIFNALYIAIQYIFTKRLRGRINQAGIDNSKKSEKK